LLGLFVENAEKDLCMGSILGNQFHFLLMQPVKKPAEWALEIDGKGDRLDGGQMPTHAAL
jgi:hypothetical protein